MRSATRIFYRRSGDAAREGQNMVEFAIVSVMFLMIVFGTVDFGRAIYLKSQLESAVREAAREARTRTANGNVCGEISQALVQHRVRNLQNYADGFGCNQGQHPRPGLSTATATYSCSPSCSSGNKITVTGELEFQAVVQEFLGIDPLTLTSSATVTLE